ncbi:hypothetical protein B0H12DRAFT_1119081 [Mycena haematopus]|nr:hypothetical protein B0H12DRAFT_1119081 [Mycena haematopus]
MGRKKWYVVIVGRDVGVFQTWIDVSPLVTGVSGALHQSFSSEIEAEEIFAQALTNGKVKIVGTYAASVAPSPLRPNSSARSHAEVPVPADPGREDGHSPLNRPLAIPSAADRNSHSGLNSSLNLPEPVKSEVIEGTSASPYRISSPPTGVTQMVDLSSSSESAVLSPLVLLKNEVEPDDGSEQPVQNASSGRASSDLPSPDHMAASDSVRLSSSGNSLPAMTTTVVHHIHHHIHHHTYHNASENNSNREENIDSLSSQMAAFGLSPDNYVSRAADPRSPLRRPTLVPPTIPSLSRRPSARTCEGTLFSNG